MQLTDKEWRESVEWVGIVAGCVVKEDDKYLMVQEAQAKAYGLWNLPAGYVDRDELIDDAARREAKEETGLDVELLEEIGIYHEGAKKPVKHAFLARKVGGELKPQEDEILDVQWLTYEQIKKLHEEGKIRAEWIFEAITTVESSTPTP